MCDALEHLAEDVKEDGCGGREGEAEGARAKGREERLGVEGGARGQCADVGAEEERERGVARVGVEAEAREHAAEDVDAARAHEVALEAAGRGRGGVEAEHGEQAHGGRDDRRGERGVDKVQHPAHRHEPREQRHRRVPRQQQPLHDAQQHPAHPQRPSLRPFTKG